jgi:hypothetical protein
LRDKPDYHAIALEFLRRVVCERDLKSIIDRFSEVLPAFLVFSHDPRHAFAIDHHGCEHFGFDSGELQADSAREIIESLNLRRPIYKKTAAYGHFGRTDPDFTWEATDKAAKLARDVRVRETVGTRK